MQDLKVGNADGPFGGTGIVEGWMHPGSLYVIKTAEEITVPKDCIGVVALRHQSALGGVCLTSPILLNPGFTGRVELAVSCYFPIRLQPGAPVGKMMFMQCEQEDKGDDDSFLQ